jgi:hypothetical protein
MGNIVARIFPTHPVADASWLEGSHGLGKGNVASIDGSVEKMKNNELRELLQQQGDPQGGSASAHFLFPKR